MSDKLSEESIICKNNIETILTTPNNKIYINDDLTINSSTPKRNSKGNNDKDYIGLNEKAEKLKSDLNDVNIKFNCFINDVISNQTLVRLDSCNDSILITKDYDRSSNENNKDTLPDRIFIKRNSLLTEMFKIAHIRTIRHIFISIMIILILQIFAHDFVEKGKIDFNFDLIKWCFGKFNIVFYTWIYMKLSTAFLVYYCFYHWSYNRQAYIPIDKKSYNFYDIAWLIIFIVYLIIFLICPAMIVIYNELPIASSITVLMEQLRMLMKSYAFVRSNIPRALMSNMNLDKEAMSDNEDNTDEVKSQSISPCPFFSNYLYFLFAPTLVYRDNYPRSSRVRWHHVFNNLAQVCGAIFYTYCLFQRFCIPVFQHFNTEHVTVKMFVQNILNCTLPGGLLLLIFFFSFLHCWLNAFAEMLSFADRMFYKDWWNSTNFPNYYRTWNVVVHDWLYTYIYKDLYTLLGKRYKAFSQFVIFIVSAIFHEYVLTLAFGFFYPVLCTMFGAIGFLFMFWKPTKHSNFWNFIYWMSMLIGLGCLMCLYSIEWYARKNCASSFDSFIIDFVLPRSFTCGRKDIMILNTKNFYSRNMKNIEL